MVLLQGKFSLVRCKVGILENLVTLKLTNNGLKV